MKATTMPIPNKAAPKKKKRPSRRKNDRSVRCISFDEMRRLMRIYGPTKCLRKRQTPDNKEVTVDSVKRKFYRWFPDLDERFQRDELTGQYHPRAGHQFELRYREEMRTKDGDRLSKKRVAVRAERHGTSVKRSRTTKPKKNTGVTSTATNTSEGQRDRVYPVSPTTAPVLLSDPEQGGEDGFVDTEITLNQLYHPMGESAITADTEPVDHQFIAEEGIFDAVERSFFGPTVNECPSSGHVSLYSSSSSSEEEEGPPYYGTSGSSSSDDSITASIDEVLDKSIEECCDELLGSDDNSMDSYLLDMII